MAQAADQRPEYGAAVFMEPGLVRIVAPNPSAMTFWGTNTYILGTQNLCVIDPGPDDPRHLAALLGCIDGRRVSHIVVTHSHLDHSALSLKLSRATNAPVLAFGDCLAGRSGVMMALAQSGDFLDGEGVDTSFQPDSYLPDGARLQGPDWDMDVIHTPGHMGNHICLRWGPVVFCGDHVMGWASTMVSPPFGDLTDFMQSCRRLAGLAPGLLYPGHGAPIADPAARIGWLLHHRTTRETQILAQLHRGPMTIDALTAALYADTPATLHAAAARNVFAHLIDLAGRNLVSANPALGREAVFCSQIPA